MQVLKSGIQSLGHHSAYDLVVIGAGGAGMATALFAALEGASVLLVERTEFVGGTTACLVRTCPPLHVPEPLANIACPPKVLILRVCPKQLTRCTYPHPSKSALPHLGQAPRCMPPTRLQQPLAHASH